MKRKTKNQPPAYSPEHARFLKKTRRESALVISLRVSLLVLFLALWEVLAQAGVIDAFLMSCPSRICKTIGDLFRTGDLMKHIGITLYETVAGFLIATVLGTAIALLLWWSERARKVCEPYIVVINSLPKIALGPVIIIWFGAGMKSIIFMAVLVAIVVTIITMLSGFLATDRNKIFLLESMGATKPQILKKLILPASLPTFISMLKINVGMAWIGSIMGEYLVSRAGLGYLIVYGGQVFKLDLVMAATVILCLLAAAMYAVVALLEKLFIRYND